MLAARYALVNVCGGCVPVVLVVGDKGKIIVAGADAARKRLI